MLHLSVLHLTANNPGTMLGWNQCLDQVFSMFCDHIQPNKHPHPLTYSPSLLFCFCTDWINGLTGKELALFPLIAGIYPISWKILELFSLEMWWWEFGGIHQTGHFIAESMLRISYVCGISKQDSLIWAWDGVRNIHLGHGCLTPTWPSSSGTMAYWWQKAQPHPWAGAFWWSSAYHQETHWRLHIFPRRVSQHSNLA